MVWGLRLQARDHAERERRRPRPVDDAMVERDRDVADGRTVISSSRTTGRGPIRWIPRMPTSGWLTSGVTTRPPSLPALVIVNVLPRSSSGFSVPRGQPRRAAPPPPRAPRAKRSRSRGRRARRAPGRLHGDAEVVALEVDDLVALEARVQLRVLGERGRDRFERERQQLLQVDVGEVALLDERHRRHLAVGLGQVLGDLPPHPAQGSRRPSEGLCSIQTQARSAGRADIALRDAAVRSRAAQLSQIHPELLRDPAHDRGRLHATL